MDFVFRWFLEAITKWQQKPLKNKPLRILLLLNFLRNFQIQFF
jgi:hypothetical protein